MFQCLRGLVAATQQHDDRRALVDEIQPVARPIEETHLRDAFAHRRDIAQVADAHGAQPRVDSSHRAPIAQAAQPARKGLGLDDLKHGITVNYSWHVGNCGLHLGGAP
jgi:hypothetical protein